MRADKNIKIEEMPEITEALITGVKHYLDNGTIPLSQTSRDNIKNFILTSFEQQKRFGFLNQDTIALVIAISKSCEETRSTAAQELLNLLDHLFFRRFKCSECNNYGCDDCDIHNKELIIKLKQSLGGKK